MRSTSANEDSHCPFRSTDSLFLFFLRVLREMLQSHRSKFLRRFAGTDPSFLGHPRLQGEFTSVHILPPNGSSLQCLLRAAFFLIRGFHFGGDTLQVLFKLWQKSVVVLLSQFDGLLKILLGHVELAGSFQTFTETVVSVC